MAEDFHYFISLSILFSHVINFFFCLLVFSKKKYSIKRNETNKVNNFRIRNFRQPSMNYFLHLQEETQPILNVIFLPFYVCDEVIDLNRVDHSVC